ncbi:MAG: S8 family serine peptidase [Saprospiraceae bacterium]|nr:S8 family serine peptidase [Saprospiraceae bacterium]
MNFRRLCLFSLLLLSTAFSGFSQTTPYEPGQVLVSLQPGLSPQNLALRLERQLAVPPITTNKVSTLLNVWIFETLAGSELKSLDWLRAQPEVRQAQLNFWSEERNDTSSLPYPYKLIPNDPLFPQQWQYINAGSNGGTPNADLDADLAWDIATGGLTPAGDTIVVAVIDGGVDPNHPDLSPNLWRNWGEIPGDGIDNDNNGYVDDFRGWNVFQNNDNIAGNSMGHGTPVSAIVGARGNNAVGVTGVNWNVQIMFVAGGGTQANILAAYDYVWQARRRYNLSNGLQGAFVVAVNSSFGSNYGQPSNAPLWCAIYDSLGQAGILSVAATANIPVNVDVVGDLPTACPSDFLVSVTNLTRSDEKAPNAAWGATHIDLGAYGQEVYTAGPNSSYGTYSGTSFATPHVSGAIGLLYAAPCPNLIALAKSAPATAALWTKERLLNSTTPNAALQGITVTGGRLNLYSLLQDYEDQCSPCPHPFAVQALDVTSHSAFIKWSQIADFQTVHLRWRAVGTTSWSIAANVSQSFLLENLKACTQYEYSLIALCTSGLTSGWSTPNYFKTDGCCEPPASLWTTSVGNTSASFAWSAVTAAQGYRLRLRTTNGSWEIHDVGNNLAFVVSNTLPCTEYEAAVQTVCDTGSTVFSTSIFFKTTGCGSCLDADYCSAKSQDATAEWIANVSIGDWEHNSGNGGGGYQNFTNCLCPRPQFFPFLPVDVTITPGYQSLPYKEFFRIYIDFNMDGDFDDPGELAFDPGWASDEAVSGSIVPPDFVNSGLTRMRVMMKFRGVSGEPPLPCETFQFGQVEDYCAELLTSPVSVEGPRTHQKQLSIYPLPAADEVWLGLPDGISGSWEIAVCDVMGRPIHTASQAMQDKVPLRLPLASWPAGVYWVRLLQGEQTYSGRILKQ